ncbi:hypothetical protein [Halomonas sp. BC04]|uniref:hypothetical protein n=1 Tax=Halomonas sp. BC04 TaxID=1403540 RepID=UPI0003ED7D7B|nr:hypothetical protein Q427_18755 [Halomonas sp. BC04]
MTSPAISDSPQGSWTISRSGGRSQPVTPGDISREIRPDGAIRKASPKAAAAWGIDSSGETMRRIQRSSRLPEAPARNSSTTVSEIRVVTRPLEKLTATERARPGWANSSRHGVRLNEVPPSAGK